MFNAVLFQWYIFMATKALAHTEALITQLVFEHSLRIRLVSETGTERSANQGNSGSSGAGTPDTTSVAGSSTNISTSVSTLKDRSNSSADAKVASMAAASESSKGKAKATATQAPTSAKPEQQSTRKDNSNLIGKINNLVTTDLGNITDARDFLLLGQLLIAYCKGTVIDCLCV